MIIHELQDTPALDLGQALATFEQQFLYPLGRHQTFRISHGVDYSKFMRSIGQTKCLMAKHKGAIVGTLSTSIRSLITPDGSEHLVAYFCDLKVGIEGIKGRVVWKLFQAAQEWLKGKCEQGFCIVMDGTESTPDLYTGRLGFKSFHPISKVTVCRVLTEEPSEPEMTILVNFPEAEGLACYRELSQGRFATPTPTPQGRSNISPIWLCSSKKSACGLLEDTRRAKRLFQSDGTELVSAHISCFAYNCVQDGVELIKKALTLCREQNIPALFFSIANNDLEYFRKNQALGNMILAPATIYGCGFPAEIPWNINTAEV